MSGDAADELEVELRRELPAAHALSGRQLRAVARRGGRDDVLFQSADGDDAVFCVHLTWSVERDPTWPWTERYENIHEFCQRWPRQQVEGDPAVEEEDA